MNPEQKPCCRKRRGRPRSSQNLGGGERYRCYAPLCLPGETGKEPVMIGNEEMEVLRLIDLEGMGQEQAAKAIGISRRTLWKDLHAARNKVADALINGKPIKMMDCQADDEGRCLSQAPLSEDIE